MIRVRASIVAALILTSVALPRSQNAPAVPSAQGKSTILEKVVVKVNGEILTLSEIERMQIEVLQDQNRQTATPRDLASDPKLMAALAEVTPQLLVEAIDLLLLVQHGHELGMKFTDENFKFALENVKKANKMDDRQLAAAMKEAGMTMDQLRQNFERTSIRQQVEQREIMRNMTLTEEEARQYFKSHPEQFMTPPTVTVREIAIMVPVETVGGQQTVNVAKDEEARDKAAALRARALKGEDFVALVTEASEAGTKANGGLIGPVLIADLAPAIGAALEKLKAGEISEVIRLGNGYRIFKLETRTASEVEPFNAVRNQISQRIYESRLGVETKKFLDVLHKQALIEWKDDAFQKMYEQGKAKVAKAG